MEDSQHMILKKEKFNDFIASLSQVQTLVAPVAKDHGNYAFENVASGNDIALKSCFLFKRDLHTNALR